eukprot:gene8387-9966_t
MALLSRALLVAACAGSASLMFIRYRRKCAIKTFLREMPKVELHVHLDGSFDEERLFHWAKLRSDILPASVKCFWDGTEIRVKEAVRYSPHLLVDKEKADMSAEDIVLAVTRGLRRGEDAFGIVVRQILCCICHCPTFAEEILSSAGDGNAGAGIVGVDIAAGEAHFKPEEPNLRQPHVLAMQRANELGLNITVHAGEEGPASNVMDAVKTYHAKRIGHGQGCPTSSYETGGFAGEDWRKHPLKQFQTDGANLSINTDDPSVFATCIEEEMLICINKMGLTLRDMATCNVNAARAAFAPEDEKELLVSKILAYCFARKK